MRPWGAPTYRRHWGPVAVTLAGVAALTLAPGYFSTSRPTSRPVASRPANSHQPVTLDLVQDYLRRWDVANLAVDPARQHVRFQVLVSRRTRLNCIVQLKCKRDGSFDRLYVACLDLANVQPTNPRAPDVFKTLVALNWQNALGTYAWDETDGEVRLEYTILANQGLCYADFADVLNRLTTTADADLPVIQRVLWK